MGVHRACFFIARAGRAATPERNRSGNQPPILCILPLVAHQLASARNYLLRRRNPTPFTIVQTTEIILYGENRILTGFRSHPPEWIAVVHKDTDEFGVRFFGRDYARRLGRWVRENCHSEVCIGALPLKSDAFGILLLRRIHQSKQPTLRNLSDDDRAICRLRRLKSGSCQLGTPP